MALFPNHSVGCLMSEGWKKSWSKPSEPLYQFQDMLSSPGKLEHFTYGVRQA